MKLVEEGHSGEISTPLQRRSQDTLLFPFQYSLTARPWTRPCPDLHLQFHTKGKIAMTTVLGAVQALSTKNYYCWLPYIIYY